MPGIGVMIRGRARPSRRAVRSGPGTAEGIIRKMGMNPQDVLVRLNGEFVPDIQRVRPGDRLELIEIASRG